MTNPSTLELPDFREFAQAAQDGARSLGPQDCLERIERWLHSTADRIDQIAVNFRSIMADAKTAAEEDVSEYIFNGTCDPEAMPAKAFEAAVRMVARDFFVPSGVEVGDANQFVVDACRMEFRHRHEVTTNDLRMFIASAVREQFAKQYPDVRETAIRQLREKVLQEIRHRRPTETTHFWTSLHHESYSRPGRLELAHEHRKVSQFSDLVKYLIHLTTGEAPSEIHVPSIHGFNDGAREWQRAEIYRKQKNPFIGCVSLRFCAGGGMDMVLEPRVLAKLQAQWDAFTAAAE